MGKDFDKNLVQFATGQRVTVDGESLTVMGGHEGGVHLITDAGDRVTIHAGEADDRCASVEITGPAPDSDGIAALHEQWAAEALAKTKQ